MTLNFTGKLNNYLIIENFLDENLINYYLEFLLENAKTAHDVGKETSINSKDYRKAKAHFSFPYMETFNNEIIQFLKSNKDIISFIGSNLVEENPYRLETQLTTSGIGDYYKIHKDNDCKASKNRLLTYIFYFYPLPKTFSEGYLNVYKGDYANYTLLSQIEPIYNRLVILNPSVLHEVTPVKDYLNPEIDNTINKYNEYPYKSRFTINGWVRQD